MKTNQIIRDAVAEHPEIRLILEIAARARETEAREQPRELGLATEVVAIPTHTQYGLLSDSGHVLSNQRYLVPGLK